MVVAVDQRELAEHASKALALAGDALDPNQQGGPCLPLGRLLLQDAFLAAARSLSGDASVDSIDAALEGLKNRPASSGQPALSSEIDDVAAVLRVEEPQAAELRRAELAVARLVELAADRDLLTRAARRGRAVYALLAVAVAVFVTFSVWVLREPWAQYEWSASSAIQGFSTTGKLGFPGAYGLLFHTKEEADPWVIVDLGSTRTIKSVLVKNRPDCCQHRGLPLQVEYAGDDRKFMLLDTRKERFQVWQASFAPVRARYVRLRVVGKNILHLHAIQIR